MRKPGYWSDIWRLKVPPKVKNLLWRIYKDCFPTRARLKSIGINCPLTCFTGNDPHEDSYHIFFHCKIAIDVWNAANVRCLIASSLSHFDNASDIIFNLLQQVSAAQLETIATIMWSIWKGHNLKLWQHVLDSSTTILEITKHILEGWRSTNCKRYLSAQEPTYITTGVCQHSDQNLGNRNRDIRWRKPRHGRYKCNVDASFSNSSNN
jgi:hypothetical protein